MVIKIQFFAFIERSIDASSVVCNRQPFQIFKIVQTKQIASKENYHQNTYYFKTTITPRKYKKVNVRNEFRFKPIKRLKVKQSTNECKERCLVLGIVTFIDIPNLERLEMLVML